MYTATLLALVALGAMLAAILWTRRRPRPIPGGRRDVPLVPGYTVAERVALDSVTTEAVRLAVQMAWADDNVHQAELAAIQVFIVDRIALSDQDFATRVMNKALEHPLALADQTTAISTIRAVGSHRQHLLTVRLLVRVAVADGALDPKERAFVETVGAGLGLSPPEVAEILLSTNLEAL